MLYSCHAFLSSDLQWTTVLLLHYSVAIQEDQRYLCNYCVFSPSNSEVFGVTLLTLKYPPSCVFVFYVSMHELSFPSLSSCSVLDDYGII